MLPPRVAQRAAEALDAADGVIDGKFNGRPTVECRVTPAKSRPSAAEALNAADGVFDGKFHGRPIVERRISREESQSHWRSAAAALNAAVGVIYGYFHRQPIVENIRSSNRRHEPRPPSAADVIDSLDGVMDGKFFGTPIMARYVCVCACA